MAEGTRLFETHPVFQRRAEDEGLDLDALFAGCAREGSIQSCSHLSAELRRVFVVARDISPEWHVRMQAAFQQYADTGVSKTINLARTATVEDVRRAFLTAWRLKCKGITVYREGCRGSDVLTTVPPGRRLGDIPSIGEESCDPIEAGPCRRCPG